MTITERNPTTYDQTVRAEADRDLLVEFGDAKQSEFFPQAKILLWGNEVNFSLRADLGVAATHSLRVDNVVEYQSRDYNVEMLDKPSVSDEGGLAFDWVLLKKPVSNILRATIRTKGLKFHKQPDRRGFVDEYGSVHHQADNVPGSYAVTHATKAHNFVDRAGNPIKSYRVGKAFHIYRPEAIDAVGKRVWCDLDIDTVTQLLTVTVPQGFLDTAAYPITVDPDVGYNTAGASNFSPTQISHDVFSDCLNPEHIYTASTGDEVTAFHAYAADTNAGIGFGMYDLDGSDVPQALQTTEQEVTIDSTTDQWFSTTGLSESLSNGVTYAIGLDPCSSGALIDRLWYDRLTGEGYDYRSREASQVTLPATWVEDFRDNYSCSVYFTVTVGSPATAASLLTLLGVG